MMFEHHFSTEINFSKNGNEILQLNFDLVVQVYCHRVHGIDCDYICAQTMVRL